MRGEIGPGVKASRDRAGGANPKVCPIREPKEVTVSGYSVKLEDIRKQIEKDKDTLINFENCKIDGDRITECREGCEYYQGLIESVAREKKPQVNYMSVTLDLRDPECRLIADSFNIDKWPSLIAFKDGKEVKRVSPVGDFEKDARNIEESFREVGGKSG